MPYKVVALVYPNRAGETVTSADNDTKRALRSLRSSLTAHFGGRTCYTSWGDNRGRDEAGNEVLGYAVTMEVSKDDVPWFLETFWGASTENFVEVIPGVGYVEKTGGRAPMFSLDVEDLEEGVKAIVASYGIDFVEPQKQTRAARTPKPTDPYGSVTELLALCNESIEGFDVVANLGTPRAKLVEAYEATLQPATDEEGEDALAG